MKFVLVLSYLYLIISYLLFKKTNKKQSILFTLIYILGLLFCYNVVIVFCYSLFIVKGSLLVISLLNLFIGTIFNILSFRKKELQKYYFEKKELCSICLILVVVFLVACFRFRGFTTISYESADSTVHYGAAVSFSNNLVMLNEENSKDLVYGGFAGLLPISHINCGILMNLLSDFTSYWVFILFDCFCLILSSLLFLVTVFSFLKKKNYYYSVVLTCLYTLGFPLNCLVFGFSYLGVAIMVINLLILTICNIKRFDKNLFLNLFLIFMICFSVFFSYYLFVPCIYLALGLYYIYLWVKKKITFKKLFIYGSFTLLVPFIIGLINFIVPGFINSDVNIFEVVGFDGYIYDNTISRYFFILVSFILLVSFRKQKKFNYYWLSFGIVSLYILLFYILFKLDVVSLYYLYKLFYLYWFFSIIFIGILLLERKVYLYTIFIFVVIAMGIVYLNPDSIFSDLLVKSNIFSWNARSFIDDKIILTEKELDLVHESIKYNDLCVNENQFLISGEKVKNPWVYSITGNIPLFDYKNSGASHLGGDNIKLDFWKYLNDYKCLIYFYEDENISYDRNEFKILYSNSEGAILMKKEVN